MPAFRLRVRTTEIDLPLGELVMGRGSDCFLRINDDLVSRRHARLFVTDESVVLEDLGSRNGSRVNGQKLEGQIPLRVGDNFEVGSQTFQLITGGVRDSLSRTMLPHRPCRSCAQLIPVSTSSCPHCGAAQRDEKPVVKTDEFDVPPRTQAFANSFSLVTGLGDKLLALGRTEEAERMLGPRLHELLARARSGDATDGKVAIEALRRGVRLAVLTGRGEWYGWTFEFARLTAQRIDDKTIDELHTNMLVHKPAAAEALMFYFAGQTGDDADTLLHRKRLEALLRFCRD